MKIFVTGGSGFVASEIVKLLLKKKHNVTIYDLKKPNFSHPKLKYIKGNTTNKNFLRKAIKGNDVVYHFAAMADIDECLKQPLKTVYDNILSTVIMLSLCSFFKIKRFIFASTIYVHSDQGGFYKVSKQSAEGYIKEFSKRKNLKYTILRYGTIYGPSNNLKNNINKISNFAIKTGIVKYESTQKVRRKIIHSRDAAKAALGVLKKKYENKSVLITGKKEVKIKDIMIEIAKNLKIHKQKIFFENKKIEGHYISSPYTNDISIDINYKLKKEISLKRGISEVIKYIKNK